MPWQLKDKPIALLRQAMHPYYWMAFLGYIFILYFTVRSDFYQLMALFALLFGLYALIYRKVNTFASYQVAILWAIAFRVALLFTMPNLSDDLFRFYWDGLIMVHGISPFTYLPQEVIEQALKIPGLTANLYESLNSPSYFTIYPPVNQFLFWLGAKIAGPDNIWTAMLVMKSGLLAFEVGSIYLIHQLVQRFQLPFKLTLLYALNPLVIVELVGNLHFEAAMIFFSLLAVYCLSSTTLTKDFTTSSISNKNFITSAIAMALAVCSKLLPLIFLPFLIKRLGWLKGFLYGLIVALVSLMLFLPLFSPTIAINLFSSIELYFQKFEFNASIYYIVRWIGFQIKGWNVIGLVSKWFVLGTFSSILLLALFERNLSIKHWLQSMLFALFLYLSLATIVHPWYITTLVAFSVFTNYRFPILWSALILLSYYTYRTTAYEENLYLVAVEYLLVFAFLLYELALVKKSARSKKPTI